MEQPDGIIITISQKMLEEKGIVNWTKNFLNAMAAEDMTYWMRQGSKPKRDILYVYLCIGGRVRFRALFAGTDTGLKTFNDGTTMFAKVWIMLAGPVVKPIRGQEPEMKGFRGFRYTEKLF